MRSGLLPTSSPNLYRGSKPRPDDWTISAADACVSCVGLTFLVLGASVITAVKMSGGAGAVSRDQAEQLAAGLRLDGLIGCALVIVAWLALGSAAFWQRLHLESVR